MRLEASPEEIAQFAALLRRCRRLRGLTQRGLAARSGLCHSSVTNLEAGLYAPMSITVIELAHALSVDTTQLWPGSGEWL